MAGFWVVFFPKQKFRHFQNSAFGMKSFLINWHWACNMCFRFSVLLLMNNRMQLRSCASFSFETNVSFKSIYISFILSVKHALQLLHLDGVFFSPLLLFVFQQTAVNLLMVVNRATLLLLLESPGETSNLVTSPVVKFSSFWHLSSRRKHQVILSHQKWRKKKWKCLSRFRDLKW